MNVLFAENVELVVVEKIDELLDNMRKADVKNVLLLSQQATDSEGGQP